MNIDDRGGGGKEWEKTEKLQLTSEIERELFLFFLFFIKMSVKGK